MADDACPGCGANLKIETRGDLHDKLQVCPHCGFERDVLDEVTIHKQEAGKEVTIHRRDLGGEAPSEREPRDPEAIDAQVRELMGDEVADLVKEALSGPQAGGKVVTHTSTTVSTSTTDGEVVSGAAAAELLAQHGISIRGLGGDPIESQTYSGEQAEAKLGEGRVRWIHPDCGFWMLKRSVADRKIAALAAGRDLYLGQ